VGPRRKLEGGADFDSGRGASVVKQARKILKSVFGYDRFISLQEQVIANVLRKRDTLAVMPTGGGKSICFQIPALLLEGPVVVVSPLISLMKDQVDQLRQLEIPTAVLNSSLSYDEYRKNVEQVRDRRARLVYLAPETLLKPAVLNLLTEACVSLLAIDEAHCISQWGHDFRPEYRRLAELRPQFSRAACLALTATATEQVRQDITGCLHLAATDVLIAGFNRENLFIQVVEKVNPAQQTIAFLRRFPGDSGIIYCSTRRQVDELAAVLRGEGFSAAPYHAGMSDEQRARTQRQFVHDEVLVVVATIAFGMGIDKSNVRFVLHYNLPRSLENYYQEIGRAGRDGLRADCLLLFSYADTVKARYLLDKIEDAQRRRAAGLQLNAMVQFAEAEVCRRMPLLGYFGEAFSAQQCGGMCDNCVAGERPRVDLTVAAQKFLSCVKRTGERFGAAHIIAVLRGSRAARVRQNRHDQLSTYGIGMEFSRRQWRQLVHQFLQQGLLRQDTEYGGLSLTADAWDVLRGRKTFMGTALPEKEVPPASAESAAQPPADYQRELFERLRAMRSELARTENVPPYVILTNRTLDDLTARLPGRLEELLHVHGIGTVKQEKYGAAILEVIREYRRQHPEAEPVQP
jgi:ATP-dependent DNA helicase RecQ